MSKLADVLESLKGGHARTITATAIDLNGGVQVGSSVFAVSNWISQPTEVGQTVALLVQDGAVLGLGPTDGSPVEDGYARGTWPTQAATGGAEYLMKNPNVLTKTDNITLTGTGNHTFVLGKVGYWIAGFSLGFSPNVPYDHSRWFLSLVVPGVDGTGALSAYRQSIGPGENIQGVSGLCYSDGSGQVQFRIYNTNTGGVSTNGNFFIKYLGEVLNVGGSSGGGVTDHGLLTGLSDDDHPQYALTNGTRGNFETAGAVDAHEAAADPHPQYLQPSEVVAGTDIDVDTTTTPGSVIINSTATGAPAFGISIKEYGAVGDGTTDDTTAINNAIAALGANGGRLLVPAGNYRVEGTISLVDGLAIQGESSRRSRFYKPNDGNLLVGVDTDRFSLRDIYLVGPGQGVGSGNALTITRSALDALTAIDLLQVNVTSFGGNGIDLDGSLANTLERVYVTAVGNIGIHLHHSKPQAGATSSTLSNCFVAGAATGYRLDECAYMALLGCASDDTTTAYHLTTCFAVAMIGCGAEVATNAIRLEQACRAVSIESFYMLGMTGSGIYTNDAQVWLTGLYEEPGSGTYSVEATGPGTVKYVNCTFTRPMTGNVESVAIGDFVPRAGGTFTGDVTVASQTLRVANPSGTAEFVMDRPDGASIGQVVFATDGVNDGWALTHLNNTGNFRIWNFSQGANAMTFDAAGTYINAHNKRITNVTDPTAAQDAATRAYVDNRTLFGYANGRCANTPISSGAGEVVMSPTQFYRSSGVTQVGSDIRFDLGGYWQVTYNCYLDTIISAGSRAFLSIYGPDVNGANVSLAYRSSFGDGEDFGSVTALVYANAINGSVRFQVYQATGATITPTGNYFWLAYLGQ